MTSISANELRKQILEMSARSGLSASFFEDIVSHNQYATYSAVDFSREYLNAPTYQPPEPKKIYLGMYVYVETWPEVPVFEQSKTRVCINAQCPEYLVENMFTYGESCDACGEIRRHFAIEVKKPANVDILVNNIVGAKCFKMVEDKDKKFITPYPEYAFELGGTIIEDNLMPLKGIIDALKRSEKCMSTGTFSAHPSRDIMLNSSPDVGWSSHKTKEKLIWN